MNNNTTKDYVGTGIFTGILTIGLSMISLFSASDTAHAQEFGKVEAIMEKYDYTGCTTDCDVVVPIAWEKKQVEEKKATAIQHKEKVQKRKAEEEAERQRILVAKQKEKERIQKEKKAKEAEQKEAVSSPSAHKGGNTSNFEVTAYTADPAENGGWNVTALGTPLVRGTCAVDPRVIPLGTKLHVEGYGSCTAADTGGAIKGKRIDILVDSKGEASNWGRRTVKVTIY